MESLSIFEKDFTDTTPKLSTVSVDAQCQAMLNAATDVISSIMGLFPSSFFKELKDRAIKWFAMVSSVGRAFLPQEAGADAIVVQGSEAGGHLGNFSADYGRSAGLMELLPTMSDAVTIPIVATNSITDSGSVAAAIILGASAVQIGTGLLKTREAAIPLALANALKNTRLEDAIVTKTFTGKPGKAISNQLTNVGNNSFNPSPTPFPIQCALTASMRSRATVENKIANMHAWADQSASLAREVGARELIQELWIEILDKFKWLKITILITGRFR